MFAHQGYKIEAELILRYFCVDMEEIKMNMYDLILKKRDGGTLSAEEIKALVRGIADGSIPDYQLSAFLMAVYFKGLSFEETACLTDEMAHSGEMANLSEIEGIKVDKHSTGGVGDKTTLVIAPIVASCGVPVAKMSGRGLGHTGGTVDKLESIKGFDTQLSAQDFIAAVKKAGLAVIGQSGNFAPADKKLYALRDVTATVDSIPLIAASIMSKKIAAGADAIVLDVKTGSGAFMHTLDGSIELAKTMVEIGTRVGRKTVALVTEMDMPLGAAVGNTLEVVEAVETLKGIGPDDLTAVSVELAANMLFLANKGEIEFCRELAKDAIYSGRAFKKLKAMVKAQGGDDKLLDAPERFPQAKYSRAVVSPRAGYLQHMDTQQIGRASVELGAGRLIKDAPIDHSAGIMILCKTGDAVAAGDVLALLYSNDEAALEQAEKSYLTALTIGDAISDAKPLIYARVSEQGVERL